MKTNIETEYKLKPIEKNECHGSIDTIHNADSQAQQYKYMIPVILLIGLIIGIVTQSFLLFKINWSIPLFWVNGAYND